MTNKNIDNDYILISEGFLFLKIKFQKFLGFKTIFNDKNKILIWNHRLFIDPFSFEINLITI